MTIEEQIKSSVWGAVLGDALGVPVESSTRAELALCSVKNMLGFGRYDQPRGTWSDDSAMVLCTMESLCKGYNLEDMARTFCSWMFEGQWTATGFVFDAGITTLTALESIHRGERCARDSGAATEDDNGNGSLMRILPAALYFADEEISTFLNHIHEVSAITHAHPRAMVGCGIYALLVRRLLEEPVKEAAYQSAVRDAQQYYGRDKRFGPELKHYLRILSGTITSLEEREIETTGYVVHTLEAATWSFLHHDTTAGILLQAVNLGLETDTTGTVAGGLAGLTYGLEGVPRDWLDSLARGEDIAKLIEQFAAVSLNRRMKV
ncbi:MAG: ADP-ribosylglycohydrolase family protein [Chitinivibrionales bacterium]|nr:ADP-ribosylglycohydrolase family protein [Chitinivibrionales bacterium]MBD3357835.1 ADP-ribosylglycohydrolase family protein [Chitinivibrionales bacterium]